MGRERKIMIYDNVWRWTKVASLKEYMIFLYMYLYTSQTWTNLCSFLETSTKYIFLFFILDQKRLVFASIALCLIFTF